MSTTTINYSVYEKNGNAWSLLKSFKTAAEGAFFMENQFKKKPNSQFSLKREEFTMGENRQ